MRVLAMADSSVRPSLDRERALTCATRLHFASQLLLLRIALQACRGSPHDVDK